MENDSRYLTRTAVMRFLRSRYFIRSLIIVMAGALGGFLFYYFIGCQSGTCAITSNPYSSIITGGLIGFLIIGSPKDNIKKDNNNKDGV